MKPITILLWAPRVLAMVLALFLATIAMHVYLEGKDFWETSQAFVTNLLPSLCVISLIAIGWRRDGFVRSWLPGVGHCLLRGLLRVEAAAWVAHSYVPSAGDQPGFLCSNEVA